MDKEHQAAESKPRKPIWKKWWFWTTAPGLFFLIIMMIIWIFIPEKEIIINKSDFELIGTDRVSIKYHHGPITDLDSELVMLRMGIGKFIVKTMEFALSDPDLVKKKEIIIQVRGKNAKDKPEFVVANFHIPPDDYKNYFLRFKDIKKLSDVDGMAVRYQMIRWLQATDVTFQKYLEKNSSTKRGMK